MSFFFGNYITLTNLTPRDVDRIIEMRISPINISVHTMNPELRVQMMKNKNAGSSLDIIKKLAGEGIEINTQLVLCPGINDGKELEFSLEQLASMYPSVRSIATVPLGLTKHRQGLCELEEYTRETAGQTIDIIENFSNDFLIKNGTRLVFAADEFYIKAGRKIPDYEFYEDFQQLENGVGMWALLKHEFEDCLKNSDLLAPQKPFKITIATGVAAFPLINELAGKLQNAFAVIAIDVVAIKNDFFGHSITVAGLVTAKDLISQLKEKSLGDALFIPSAMLKGTYPQDDNDDCVFLDDISLEEVQKTLGVKIVPLQNDGYDFYYKDFGGGTMARPVVAIVGRPNVGKSTLFNKLIGQRLSIVDDTPGVTRDRIYGDCDWLGHNLLLIDTGGIEPYSDDIILSQMRRQAQLAIDSADVIIFVTDLRTGIVATDSEVATMLQKRKSQ